MEMELSVEMGHMLVGCSMGKIVVENTEGWCGKGVGTGRWSASAGKYMDLAGRMADETVGVK